MLPLSPRKVFSFRKLYGRKPSTAPNRIVAREAST